MATYIIGDLQGCFHELQSLLSKIEFDRQHDHIWLTGDLINRGPSSLETLRFVKQQNFTTVLGNHDMHFLAVASGVKAPYPTDTFEALLQAPDCDELCDWLRKQPLIYQEGMFTLFHAGLPPQWDLNLAKQCASEVEQALQSTAYKTFLAQMYGNTPDRWNSTLHGFDRLRFITNCLTRLRFCYRNGQLTLDEKGDRGSVASDIVPWFELYQGASNTNQLIFGHWAALNGNTNHPHIHAIDTGCVWGNALTALRLEDLKRISVAAKLAQ